MGRRGDAYSRDASILVVLLGLGALLSRLDSPNIAVALVAAAVALATMSPLAAVIGGVTVLPLAYKMVAVGGLQVSALELAVIAAVAGTSLSALSTLGGADGRARLRRAVQPWWLPAAAMSVLAVGTVSVLLVGREHLDENLRVYRWTILEPVGFWFACRWALQGDTERRLAAMAFVAVGAMTGALAVGEAVLGMTGLVDGAASRPELAFPHPNNLAFFLERVSVLALGLAVTAGRSRWWTAAACVALGGVVATVSRGAYLAVAVGVVWLAGGAARRNVVLTAGIAVGIGAVVALWQGGRLLDAGGTGDVPTRLPIWRSSVRMVLDHPLSGVGLDGFLYEYWRRYVEPIGWPERYTSHPHNLFLDVWLRLGILGPLVLAMVAVATVLAVRHDRRRRPGPSPLAGAATAALVAGLAHGLVDNGFFLPDLAMMTWFLIALSVGPATGAPSDSP